MATAGGSYQIHIRVSAHRAARRLKSLQSQLSAIDSQVRAIPTSVMDEDSVTTAGTKRIKARSTATRGYGTAAASAAKGVRALNRASAGLGENLASVNANTPGAVKTRQMKEYAGAMRSFGTGSTKAATGAAAFKKSTAGMDLRLERIAKALPEAAVGVELLDHAMKGTDRRWDVMNKNLATAAPAMTAYANATNAAAAAQERMNRASLGATKKQAIQDKPVAAVTRTGNVVKRSTAVQASAAAASANLTGAVHQNYEELTKSARALAASTSSLTAFGRNASIGAQGVDVLSASNNKLAASITAVAAAQKKLNTAYAGATGQAKSQKVATTTRTGNTVRAAKNAAGPVTVTTDVQAMYRNLEGVSTTADSAAPRIDRLATSMERYAAAAKLASNSTRNLARHLGTVSATAPRAAGAMNVATDSAAKTSLAAAAAAAGTVGTASAGAGAEIDKADKAMGRWSNTARTHGATMNWAGRQISMFFTLPLALAGGAAIKWQMDNEKAMTQVAKVYDGATSDIKNSLESINEGGPHFQDSPLDRFFTELSIVMGKNKAEVADIAGDWAAVGMHGPQLASATQLTTEMMVLGDMEAAEATRTLIAVQAQYGLTLGNLQQELEAAEAVEKGVATAQQRRIVETESLTDAMATMNAVENATGATMADLARGFERTAAPARQLGIDVQTLGAHMATLVPAMGTAERAGIALKTIYQSLAAPRTERQVTAMRNLALNAGLAGDAFLNNQFLAEGMGKGIEKIAQAYSQLQGADRFTWARDVFGVYQYARAVQMLEDVSRGMGYQTDEHAEFMRSLGAEFEALTAGAPRLQFLADNFGIAMDDMSEEAQAARQDISNLLLGLEEIESLSYYQKAGGSGDLEGALSNQDKLKLYEAELNTFLESNPHRFAQAMQMIKNSMADFIVPILPLIVAITQELAMFTQKLADLPPEAQKMIAIAVLTIAAFGPLIALFGTFFIATAMMGKAFTTLGGFLKMFRRDSTRTVGAVGKLAKALAGLKRLGGGGGGAAGGLLGGGGGSPLPPSPVPLVGGGSAWPREDPSIKAATDAVDKLGDESSDLARSAGPAARNLDAFTAAIHRQISATARATGASGAGAAGAAAAGGAAGDALDGKGKGKGKKDTGAGASAFAGAMAGNIGIPGLGKLFKGKKLAADAKKAQGAAAAVEKKGMMARLGAMLNFNKDAAKASATGGKGIVSKLGGALKFLPRIFTGPFKLVARLLPRLIGVAFGPIGWAISGVVLALELMGVDVIGKIGEIFSGVGDVVSDIMGDDGVPLLAKPFVAAVGVIGKVLTNLPKIVADVAIGILNTLRSMAEGVAKFFSSLNPFQRHSPSLVDNVTRGMAIIGGKFKDMGRQVGMIMHAARNDVKSFGAATAGLSMNVENVRIAENREKIATHAPQAVPMFDSLVGHQRALKAALEDIAPAVKAQEQAVEAAQRAVDGYDKTIERMSRSVELAERRLDALNDRLSEAQENFDRYANAQIAGLGAVDDAIFDNEMAQKRLQLALKKAGADDMSTTEDALSRIQGQMDDMSAKREALRLGGAGAEILSVYDQNLNELAGQRRDKMTGPTTEIERMNKALEDLQDRAEIMDLERALKFDPLNRQLDQMRTKTEEMSFERIAAGMALHGAQVDLYQGQVDRASEAIDRQRDAITAVEDQRYLANQALDAEQVKLEEVTAAQNAMQEVLDEVSAALDVAISDAEAYAAHLKDVADKANEAKDALSGLGDEGFGDAADFDVPGGSFNPDEMLPSIEEQTENIRDRIKEMFDGINLGDGLKNFGSKVWNGLVKAIASTVPSASYLVGYVIGVLARFAEVLGEETSRLMGEVMDFGADIIQWFKDVDWALVGQTLTDGEWWAGVAKNIWDGLGNGLKAFWDTASGWVTEYIVDPFKEGFKKGFGIASPAKEMEPFGGDIIAGVFEGVKIWLESAGAWFAELPGKIGDALGNWWEIGKTKASDIWGGIQEKWGEVVENVRAFGSDIWTKLKEGLGDLWGTAKTWVHGLKEGVAEKWDEVTGYAWELGSKVYEKIKEGLGDLWQLGVDTAEGLMRGLESTAKTLWNRAKEWAENAVGGTQEGVDSHSPSRATMAVGRDVGLGFILGMEQSTPDVARAAAEMAAAAIPDAAPLAAQAQQAAPAQESPFQALAADAQAGFGQVQAIAQVAADTTSTDYLATMGGMRAADLASQSAHVAATAANATMMSTTAIAQATTMATGVTSQAALMAAGVIDSGTNMATGVLNAGASMEAGMNASMARMSANIAGVINGEIAPVIGSIDPMLSTMTGWFDSSVNNVGTIWAGIEPRTKDPARVVINDVYDEGLRGAWNSFNEFLDLPELPSYRAKFASGGVLPGYTPGRDVHRFVSPTGGVLDLSGGEAIMRPEFTRAIGKDGVDRLNKIAAQGGVSGLGRAFEHMSLGGYAAGGVLPYVGGFNPGGVIYGGGYGGLTPITRSHAEWVGRHFPNMFTLTSALRFTDSGYHSTGQATDWQATDGQFATQMPTPYSKAMARAMHATFPNAAELIHWPLDGWQNIWHGRPHNYGSGTNADHTNHIHFATQGPIQGGIALGSFEGAITPLDWSEYISDKFKEKLGEVEKNAPTFGGGIGEWIPASIEKAMEAATFLADHAEEYFAAMMDPAGPAVERWRPLARQALARHGYNPDQYIEATLKQIEYESSGDPRSINLWDSNAIAGHPSGGLLHVIEPTYRRVRNAYPEAFEGLPDDRWHPLTNLTAGVGAVRMDWGGPGGRWPTRAGYDAGGILPPTPGGDGTSYTHTRKPEMVLTTAQWRALYRAATLGPSHLAGVAAEAASAAVEQVTAMDSEWKAAILGETEAISEAVSEPPADPWEAFNSTLNTINDVAQKAGTIGQAILTAQEETAAALAAADERILEAANAAAEAVSEDENKIVAETEKVKDEVAKVATDTGAIAETVGAVAEDVEKVADNSESPELFTEAIERLWGEANDLYTAAIAEATGHIDRAINTGDLEGGLAALREQEARHGAEANRIAAETLTLLGNNLDTVAAVVGAWKPVVDGVYELAKAIPDIETRRNDPWMGYPGGPTTFMEKTDGALTGIWNVGAELFNLTKNVLPALVKHSVGIGSGILNFVAENADAVAAIGVALATGNVAAVLPFIPKILAASLELLPMIIQAIQEIVPALIKGIMDFVGSILDFGGRAYSYASMDDAVRAVRENAEAIRNGTFVPGQESNSGTLDRDQGGSMIVFNGDLSFPNVKNEDDAKGFLSGVQTLSGRA